tara:strand:+ start:42 stop:323 length:282 start_codon:yes stop_codon:yes gene_type:complete
MGGFFPEQHKHIENHIKRIIGQKKENNQQITIESNGHDSFTPQNITQASLSPSIDIANKKDINKFGDLEILPSEKILQFKQSLKSELSTDHSL